MRASPFAALAALLFTATTPAIAAGEPARPDPAPAPVADTSTPPDTEPPPPRAAATQIAGGAYGTLGMPALALPEPRQLAAGIGLDYFRGDFLLPGATLQKSGLAAGLSFAPAPWLELYGALAFSSANRFGPHGRETLTSLGDADLGVKLVLPVNSALSAGGLLELDLPSGVGSASLKGAGGRAAAMASLAGRLGPVPLVGTALAGYALDNSDKLLAPIATFPAYALGLSLYDRAQAGLSLEAPLGAAAPVAELQLEVPVARGQDLPARHPTRARLLLGATAIATGVRGLTASAGLAFSLVRTGRLYADAIPPPGWAPDSQWRALVSLSYAFSIPQRHSPLEQVAPLKPPRPVSPPQRPPPLLGNPVGTGPAPRHAPIVGAPPIPEGAGRLSVFVIDSHTQLPLSNSWVSAIELSDLGTTTGADGRAALDAPPGTITLAVAHDGYDPFTDSAQVLEGKDREVTVSLVPQLTDATVRGRILGEGGRPLRASVELRPLSGPPGAPVEPPLFDGAYSIAVPHGAFNLIARAPGYQAEPVRIDMLPGEQGVHDLVLHRVAGTPLVRLTLTRVEISERLEFAPGSAQLSPGSLQLLATAATLLEGEGPVVVGVRVDASELKPGEDELGALLLAEQRAQAVADALVADGLPRAQLTAHGMGIGKDGQLLLELRRNLPGGAEPRR